MTEIFPAGLHSGRGGACGRLDDAGEAKAASGAAVRGHRLGGRASRATG